MESLRFWRVTGIKKLRYGGLQQNLLMGGGSVPQWAERPTGELGKVWRMGKLPWLKRRLVYHASCAHATGPAFPPERR